MRITTQYGMINIDSKDISYSNIKNMYQIGNGYGLQLSEKLEHSRAEIIDICAEIAKKIYILHDIINI